MRTYTGILNRSNLPLNGIFVFGSNTQGRHGKGAALIAKTQFGAKYGQAKGLQGKSFAIVTKDLTKTKHPSVSKAFIIEQITRLYDFAEANTRLSFYIAYSGIGTNLNAYSPQDMADMFSYHTLKRIPDNIVFEETFAKLLTSHENSTRNRG